MPSDYDQLEQMPCLPNVSMAVIPNDVVRNTAEPG